MQKKYPKKVIKQKNRIKKIEVQKDSRNDKMLKLIDNLDNIIFNKVKLENMSRLKEKQDTDSESEKLDITQEGIDSEDLKPLETEEEATKRQK